MNAHVAPVWDRTTPSSYPVSGLTLALKELGLRERSPRRQFGRVMKRVMAVTSRLPSGNGLTVVPVMGFDPNKLAAYGTFGRVVPVIWDVWEPAWPAWTQLLGRVRSDLMFVTARQSADFLQAAFPGRRVIHLPEATTLSEYSGDRLLVDRTVEVLELGRRYARWHDAATPVLQAIGARHRFEAVPGEVIYPSRRSMVEGFADSVISVCFPSSTTHPLRAGTVETTTHRYFESLASGCIVLGHAPRELVDLFGFNPVIEVDWSDPAGQVRHVLAHRDSFQAMVDRNMKRTYEIGGWDSRAHDIVDAMDLSPS